ncbi:porphobilinogen synthase [Caulobacter vibrioides]|uniref:Delta-aminolevulinic acid dehydratase n=2 Tax=Caulobacter vibrioides TaxID=155892 RepID=Q9A8K6_CAUVC|nr:porphobilinogen synthase [Caulobacter vibrioides]YP_002516782.1 delta-aminolevulinic acid dehydratase [Caulobacter vibrioides NA1000]QBQ57039.1 porphobilinogen synthase [synthetic Caulobacter sp. 'ethensis']AAK23328.1 delta-aminolevulinic acid dehydratase [Caulobacter vibrioides CB15]ACL94874.1 delta-aminolevulinic acid dehydratase [Caulobacter vibrioides NA1000]ATC28160.1 porphobilinogen synthase [Caulobacter vibrioides]QXZ53424.1 porphobilinogen synthase [Caulobacter vibrioides]
MTTPPLAPYPHTRLRRVRQSDWVRRLVRETEVRPSDLIWSMVVHEGEGTIPVASMPGVERLSVKEAAKAAVRARDLGIPAIAIFPHIDGSRKDAAGSIAADPDGVIPRAVKAMKDAAPEVGIMCDVALDPFTDHGHDGVVEGGKILNDATIERLIEQGLMQADAGADILAPSDMMDGRIGKLRAALEGANYQDVMIMSYAAKYASAFYGPYRDAIGSAKLSAGQGDKKTYQMDPANTEEAIREVALDIAEGADMVMVKPGMPYLDILRRLVEEFRMPTYAFQVSGEYAMIMAAAQNGWIDKDRAILESLTAFKRAGAAGIITYFAPWAAEKLGA